jgi:hypothetical protein
MKSFGALQFVCSRDKTKVAEAVAHEWIHVLLIRRVTLI